ncbi:4Fe-4S binding protein [Robertmurraya siralis]
MPLKTGRFYESADVVIDRDKCITCGLCVKVCKGV